jgi:transportin-3
MHRNGTKSVVTQLVLALADLSVLLVDWADPITIMLDSYSSEPDMIPCILEFLTVLPEELHDHRFLTTDVSSFTSFVLKY